MADRCFQLALTIFLIWTYNSFCISGSSKWSTDNPGVSTLETMSQGAGFWNTLLRCMETNYPACLIVSGYGTSMERLNIKPRQLWDGEPTVSLICGAWSWDVWYCTESQSHGEQLIIMGVSKAIGLELSWESMCVGWGYASSTNCRFSGLNEDFVRPCG